MQPQAAERAVRVSTSDEGAPPIVTDAEALRRILENRVENGIKYTREGGSVRIVLRRGPAAGVVVEVVDDGPGIATEHLPRIFERFYRVDKARSREKGGTGLGLSIVKHVIALHSGEVTVTSRPGEGSTFRFEIPRTPLA